MPTNFQNASANVMFAVLAAFEPPAPCATWRRTYRSNAVGGTANSMLVAGYNAPLEATLCAACPVTLAKFAVFVSAQCCMIQLKVAALPLLAVADPVNATKLTCSSELNVLAHSRSMMFVLLVLLMMGRASTTCLVASSWRRGDSWD